MYRSSQSRFWSATGGNCILKMEANRTRLKVRMRSLLFVLPPGTMEVAVAMKWDEIEKMVRPQIVLFGDSIVESSFSPGGWGASLSHSFSRKVFPLNFPFIFISLFKWNITVWEMKEKVWIRSEEILSNIILFVAFELGCITCIPFLVFLSCVSSLLMNWFTRLRVASRWI